MALTGNKIDLILGLKLNEFFAANKRAAATYSKTKGRIEKSPIKVREEGTGNLLKRLAQIGVAYIGIRKVFSDFTTSQTNLANIASLGVENIDEIGKGIQRIGQEVPVALHDIEQGMYQVVSAGVDAANQIEVLDLAARSAKAGLAETNDALGLGSAVIKGYGKEWDEFGGVMDQAFQTVKLGQTTFPELAANMGKVVPLAATLKVETEELFGAFATLTGVTGNTAEVATQLRGIFAATVKPTAELTAAFEEYGGAAEALQQLGLAGYLKEIADKTGGNAQAMGKLIPRVEGLNAVLALSGTQFDTYIEKTDAMREATGAQAEAFDKQAETLDSQITKLDNSFQVFSASILQGVVPAITEVISLGNDFFKWFSDLDEGTQKAIVSIGIITPLLVNLPRIIKSIQIAIAGLNASLGPVGWLILGLGAFATLVLKAHDNMIKLNATIDKFNEGVKELTTEAIVQELLKLEDELNKKREQGILITAEETEKLNFLRKAASDALKDEQEKIDLTTKKYNMVNGELVEVVENLEKAGEASEKLTFAPAPVPIDLNKIQPILEQYKLEYADFIEYIHDVSINFENLNNTELEQSYIFRRNLLNGYLADVEQTHGAESIKYQNMLNRRLQMDRNYANAKVALEELAAREAAAIGAQMMVVFQGQSQALFNIGKVAAVADATINAYKGATASLAAYPMPFAAIIAAVHLALGLGHVATISSVKYKAKGKKRGGYIFASDLVGSSGIGIPDGEDGLIAAQIGETVMNRKATQMFGPILNAMNQSGRAKTSFQSGGVVEDTIANGESTEMFAAIVEDAIAKGLNRSSLRIHGEFRAKGKDLKTSIDKTEELTVTL